MFPFPQLHIHPRLATAPPPPPIPGLPSPFPPPPGAPFSARMPSSIAIWYHRSTGPLRRYPSRPSRRHRPSRPSRGPHHPCFLISRLLIILHSVDILIQRSLGGPGSVNLPPNAPLLTKSPAMVVRKPLFSPPNRASGRAFVKTETTSTTGAPVRMGEFNVKIDGATAAPLHRQPLKMPGSMLSPRLVTRSPRWPGVGRSSAAQQPSFLGAATSEERRESVARSAETGDSTTGNA